jgi:cell division control protein 6
MQKDFLGDNESIFLNDAALDYNFIPGVLMHREGQQAYIGNSIKLLEQNRNGRNLFIFGAPGIGKTLATRYVLKQVEENSENILPIYINCWKHDTSYKILLEICDLINYKFIQYKATDQLMKDIKNILNKKAIVLCLDEIDKLQDFSILYYFLEDIFKRSLIFITNEKEWTDTIDTRLKSRLYANNLEFKPYNYNEILDILKQRIEYAFVKNVFEKNCLEEICKKTYELNDVRAGIFLLKEAGDIAEQRASKKISLDDVKKAINKLPDFKIKNDLDEEQNKILELVRKYSGKPIRDIYNYYDKNVSYRTFRRRLEELNNAKLITLEEKSLGARGKVAYVYFGLNKSLAEF